MSYDDELTQIANSKTLIHALHKWNHYFPLYHRYFNKFRTTEKINMLEIGVQNGGSAELWLRYFKDNVNYFGLDIDPRCKALESDMPIKIIIGDQSNTEFLNSLCNTLPPLDIIIDDGGHTMVQQNNTLASLFSHLKPGGVYLCEDTHTSYWPGWGGGLKNPGTFIEKSKDIIDRINGYHCNYMNIYTTACSGIHYHDSMVFLEKSLAPIQRPYDTMFPGKQL